MIDIGRLRIRKLKELLNKKILVVAVLFALISAFSVMTTKSLGVWPFAPKCNTSTFRELSDSNKKICVEIDGEYQFVQTLTERDVRYILEVCRTILEGIEGKPDCSSTEFDVMNYFEDHYPANLCVSYFRELHLQFLSLRAGVTSGNDVAKWIEVNLFDSGCGAMRN